jgi:menaquinone-9 beta-reductase
MAGCATAAPLVRTGRRVLVLDRMVFPSDQLSTHVLMPAGTAELAAIGALERVLALRPSRVRHVRVEVDGVACRERVRPDRGIDFGVCVPRDLLDVELGASVREQGAVVRERCSVDGLLWRGGRVCGVRYHDDDGERHEVACKLVVGADGRRSTVSALVGAWTPYRISRNGRGLVFRYMDDPFAGTAEAATYIQWREGDSMAFAFPTTPEGRLLILLMGDRKEVGDARSDPEAYWRDKLEQHPGLGRRTAGATDRGKLRSTGTTPAFFRVSSGPGWVLAGDAGHFKDPVTGQGMRDAMFAGRTLGEALVADLDDPAAIDRATRIWEFERDLECLPAYHFANADTRVRRQSPALRELVREAARNEEPDITDLFGRARTPQQIATLPRMGRAFARALATARGRRTETLVTGLEDLATELRVRSELRRRRFRSSIPIRGSEHPGWEWPSSPAAARFSEPRRETIVA